MTAPPPNAAQKTAVLEQVLATIASLDAEAAAVWHARVSQSGLKADTAAPTR